MLTIPNIRGTPFEVNETTKLFVTNDSQWHYVKANSIVNGVRQCFCVEKFYCAKHAHGYRKVLKKHIKGMVNDGRTHKPKSRYKQRNKAS